MRIEFPVPINLSEREYVNMAPENLNQIVAHNVVMFCIIYPFTVPMTKLMRKDTPWTLQEVLNTFDVLYKLAYNQEDTERIHEVVLSCNCPTVLEEARFTFQRLDNTSCRICLSARVSSKLNLPCGHAFHVRCIRDWFKEKNACPLCNQPIIPCENCDSKRSIELSMTDNQLRQLRGEPRVPTQGPFGIGAKYYEQLYFSALVTTQSSLDNEAVTLFGLTACPDLCG